MLIQNKKIAKNLAGNKLKRFRKKQFILSHLYEKKLITANDVSSILSISLPTAIGIINELVEDNLVEVIGIGKSSGGRKPTVYGLANTSFYAIACEVGRYQTKMAIFNPKNQMVSKIKTFDTNMDDKNFVDLLYKNALDITSRANISMQEIRAFGIAMPGLIDENLGINYTIKNKENQNLKEQLSKKFQGLIYINNDARMQAHGEYIFGSAKEYKNAIIINWSWGIGMGIILNGQLFNGSTGFAGELSHIQMVEDGRLCICGKRGCLETVASASALKHYAIEAIKSKKVSQLTNRFKDDLESLQIQDVIRAAKNGDQLSMKLLEDIAYNLGIGISSVIQIINPDIVVITGPLSNARDYVMPPLQNALNKYCLHKIYNNTKVIVSGDLKHSGLLGVTAMVYHKIFSKSININ